MKWNESLQWNLGVYIIMSLFVRENDPNKDKKIDMKQVRKVMSFGVLKAS